MTDVTIRKQDNVYIQVFAEPSTRMGMSEHFARYAKNYHFHPKYKAKVWDGKIKFFNFRTGLIYAGLIRDVLEYCKENGLTVTVDAEVKAMFTQVAPGLDDYLVQLNLFAGGSPIKFRDYQLHAIKTAVTQKRRLIQSPTSSGKSSIMYGISRYLIDHIFEDRDQILVVVPTTGLVLQMKSDFAEYSTLNKWDAEGEVGFYMEGYKEDHKRIVVSTWQSVYKKPAEWFSRFRCLLFDEVHQATEDAQSILGIGKNCNAEFRIGLSGSIDDTNEADELTLTGMFGFKLVTTTTKELMERGDVATLAIKCVKLTYDGFENYSEYFKKREYDKEIDWIVAQDSRNRFVSNLANRVKGNVLILFNLVEKHGKPLLKLLKEGDKEVFFVYGGTDVDQREKIRQLAERHEGCVILASYKTFSTGVSIRNIHSIILSAPTKSFKRLVQSIGRGLRMSASKTHCDLYDLYDHLYGDVGDDKSNHTLKHFVERIRIYIKQGFDYSMSSVRLKANPIK